MFLIIVDEFYNTNPDSTIQCATSNGVPHFRTNVDRFRGFVLRNLKLFQVRYSKVVLFF